MMAGVYIAGMEMPTACSMCTFHHEDYMGDERCDIGWKKLPKAGKKPKSCPLIPVREHGRLIDADALITTFCEWGTRLERGRKLVITMSEAKQSIVDIIEDAPTIIQADKEA